MPTTNAITLLAHSRLTNGQMVNDRIIQSINLKIKDISTQLYVVNQIFTYNPRDPDTDPAQFLATDNGGDYIELSPVLGESPVLVEYLKLDIVSPDENKYYLEDNPWESIKVGRILEYNKTYQVELSFLDINSNQSDIEIIDFNTPHMPTSRRSELVPGFRDSRFTLFGYTLGAHLNSNVENADLYIVMDNGFSGTALNLQTYFTNDVISYLDINLKNSLYNSVYTHRLVRSLHPNDSPTVLHYRFENDDYIGGRYMKMEYSDSSLSCKLYDADNIIIGNSISNNNNAAVVLGNYDNTSLDVTIGSLDALYIVNTPDVQYEFYKNKNSRSGDLNIDDWVFYQDTKPLTCPEIALKVNLYQHFVRDEYPSKIVLTIDNINKAFVKITTAQMNAGHGFTALYGNADVYIPELYIGNINQMVRGDVDFVRLQSNTPFNVPDQIRKNSLEIFIYNNTMRNSSYDIKVKFIWEDGFRRLLPDRGKLEIPPNYELVLNNNIAKTVTRTYSPIMRPDQVNYHRFNANTLDSLYTTNHKLIGGGGMSLKEHKNGVNVSLLNVPFTKFNSTTKVYPLTSYNYIESLVNMSRVIVIEIIALFDINIKYQIIKISPEDTAFINFINSAASIGIRLDENGYVIVEADFIDAGDDFINPASSVLLNKSKVPVNPLDITHLSITFDGSNIYINMNSVNVNEFTGNALNSTTNILTEGANAYFRVGSDGYAVDLVNVPTSPTTNIKLIEYNIMDRDIGYFFNPDKKLIELDYPTPSYEKYSPVTVLSPLPVYNTLVEYDATSPNFMRIEFGITTNIANPSPPIGNFVLTWSDGTVDTIEINNSNGNFHSTNKAINGTGTVSITGMVTSGSCFMLFESAHITKVEKFGEHNISEISILNASKLIIMPRYLPLSVKSLVSILRGASIYNGTEVSNWNTANVQNFSFAFKGAYTFNQNLNWDGRNVIHLEGMFDGAASFNSTLSFEPQNAFNFKDMFRHATSYNRELNWNLSSTPLQVSGMFMGATSYNQAIWILQNKTIDPTTGFVNFLWGAASFNSVISQPLTSNIPSASMNGMFLGATIYNQNMKSWNVTHILTEPLNFRVGSAITNANIPNWGLAPT